MSCLHHRISMKQSIFKYTICFNHRTCNSWAGTDFEGLIVSQGAIQAANGEKQSMFLHSNKASKVQKKWQAQEFISRHAAMPLLSWE